MQRRENEKVIYSEYFMSGIVECNIRKRANYNKTNVR